MAAKRSVSVRIMDQNFMISTDASPERVQKIADFLNDNIKQIALKSKANSPVNNAILAALNITEKYFDLLEKQTKLKTDVMEKSKKIMGLLDSQSQDSDESSDSK